jgi:hypothetical protein
MENGDRQMGFTVLIEIEDLHSGSITMAGHNMTRKQAEAYCQRLNDHYSDGAIPKIASMKEIIFIPR